MRFNVIGYVTSGIGLGIMACDVIRALSDLGYEVAAFDLPCGLQREGRELRSKAYARAASQMYRDGVDVVILPVFQFEEFNAVRFGPRRVAYPLWELIALNERWARQLRRFDRLVGPSDFITDVLLAHRLNVHRAKHPHYVDGAQPNRSKFGLPDKRTIFLFSFDPSSDVRRKNPQAIIEAYRRAQPENSLLCIQVNKSVTDSSFDDLPANVVVIDKHLSYADSIDLIASCDVYVSLHRAEGLGLGMLEAMLLGKPVIATAYSGNLSFMSDYNAALVDYDCVPVPDDAIPPYRKDTIGVQASWAEPLLDRAADWMKLLGTYPEVRAMYGQRAQEAARDYQIEARRMEWVNLL